MAHTWRVMLALLMALTMWAGPLSPVHAQRPVDTETLREINAELARAEAERLRNAERLTRLETLADRQFDLALAQREDLSSLQDRVRQLSDRIGDLLATLLIVAVGAIGAMLPILVGLLRGQRMNRAEVLQARAQLARTNEQVAHVAEYINGGSGGHGGDT